MGRDPIDARLIVLVDQAERVVHQLTEMTSVHAPLARVGLDVTAVRDALRAAAAAGAVAWSASVRARLRVKARGRTAAEVAEQAFAWTREVRGALRVAGRPPDALAAEVTALRAAIGVSRPRLTGLARALDAAVISADLMAWHPPLAALAVAGVGWRERVGRVGRRVGEADVAVRAGREAYASARDRLRVQLRALRRAWSAAGALTPGLPELRLTVLARELAYVTRERRRWRGDAVRDDLGVGGPPEPVVSPGDDLNDGLSVPVDGAVASPAAGLAGG